MLADCIVLVCSVAICCGLAESGYAIPDPTKLKEQLIQPNKLNSPSSATAPALLPETIQQSFFKSKTWYFLEIKWKNLYLYALFIALPITSLAEIFIFLTFTGFVFVLVGISFLAGYLVIDKGITSLSGTVYVMRVSENFNGFGQGRCFDEVIVHWACNWSLVLSFVSFGLVLSKRRSRNGEAGGSLLAQLDSQTVFMCPNAELELELNE
ncbi:hypothetical protein FEM48_Zijuj09G0013600 [Ziziphus jujuba var. spinosa]|uniref:Uncharacterized protein n=1 Tax=Ziziphus jujuba var. spinosa TaxID=714518 RepID=A0A978UQ30_ZIZJJ|nr:hypothetical protein FEM48_Zijuj09G0013600 [Ziziphus jujuba var. spinosa]